jgi:hypothetical protein
MQHSGAFQSDPGVGITFALTDGAGVGQSAGPLEWGYALPAATATTLRITSPVETLDVDITVTVYKNGDPTALVAVLPASSIAGTVIVASGAVAFSANDIYEVKASIPVDASGPDDVLVTVTVLFATSGGGGGGGGGGSSGDILNPGADLGDNDITINPASDSASSYTLPENTLTADHAVRVANGGTPSTLANVWIIRRDLRAHTYQVKNNAGTVIYTFNPSPATPQAVILYWTGSAYAVLASVFVRVAT